MQTIECNYTRSGLSWSTAEHGRPESDGAKVKIFRAKARKGENAKGIGRILIGSPERPHDISSRSPGSLFIRISRFRSFRTFVLRTLTFAGSPREKGARDAGNGGGGRPVGR